MRVKIIAVVVAVLLLAGCSIKRDEYVSRIYKVSLGDIYVATYPETARCFGSNMADVASDIDDMWRKVVREQEKNMQIEINGHLYDQYNRDLSAITLYRMADRQKGRQFPPGLNAKQIEHCNQFVNYSQQPPVIL